MNIFGRNQLENLEGYLEEIKLHLLDNDPKKLGDLVPLTSDSKSIHVRRRVGTKREHIAVYERTMQPRLRIMADDEHAHFRKLLHHPMTYATDYKGEELIRVKRDRNPESLGRALRMLKGNGYSVARATVYHMPYPFDLNPVVVVRKHRFMGNGFARDAYDVRESVYVLDGMPAYVKVGMVNGRLHRQ